MITDDPGTPGDGQWEINFAATARRSSAGSEGELPLLDVNYGLGDYVELKYEVPWIVQDEAGGGTRSGLGNSMFGVKWRFYDAGEDGWQVSIYPQLEIRNPGSGSANRGLAEDANTFILPFQFMRAFQSVGVSFEIGREFPSHGEDAWFGGVVIGHEWSEAVAGMAELHAESSETVDRSAVTVNLGVRVAAGEQGTILMSVGRDIHNDIEEKASVLGYLGWQITF